MFYFGMERRFISITFIMYIVMNKNEIYIYKIMYFIL